MALTKIPSELSATALTITTAAQPNITSVGTLTALTTSGTVTSTGGHLNLSSDGAHIYIGADIDMRLTHSGSAGTFRCDTGDMTFDVGGDIFLDADGGQVYFQDGGTLHASIDMTGGVIFRNHVSDADIFIQGNDGGSNINMLTFDTSEGGRANFNNDIGLSDNRGLRLGSDDDGVIYNDGSNTYIKNSTVNHDIIFQGNDDGSAITAMTIDMSVGGNVGIGTSTPQKKLHIEHAAGASEGIIISGASDTNGHTAGILLRAEGGEADSALRAKGGIFLERTNTYGIGKLHIANRGNSDNVSATISDANITIDENDKVGIGTSSPAAKLHVYEETDNTDTYSNAMRIESRSSGTTVAGFGGAIYFLGERNGDGGLQGMGRIVSYAEVNSGTDLSSGMAFHTATAGVPSEKLRISHNGDVTTTGAAYNRANAGFTARKGDSVTITRASGTPLEVNRTGSDGTIQNFFNDGAIAGSVGVDGTDLWFSAGGYTEKFRITSDGDVGIGATSPNAKLHLQDGANDYTSGLFLSNADSLSEASAIWHDNSGSTTLNIESRYGNAASAIKFTLQASSGSPVTAMTMLGNGIVTKPYTPAFSCNSSGDYTTTTGDQNIKTFACSNATTLNVGSHLSGGKFTAPVDGLYHFDLKAAATYSSGYLFLYVFKNGTGVSNHYHYMHQTSRSATLSFTIYAEEDDYFEPYVNTNYSGGTVNAIVFSGHFIG